MNALVRNGQGGELARQAPASGSPFQRLFGFDPFQGVMSNWDYGFEVSRTDNGYDVEVPIPGFNSSQVEVNFKDNILSINGKNDRRTFSRSLTVPEDGDPEKIAASVSDGMLRISFERHPESQPRRITVS
ncbi:MAG TPA: Hsp20 family protein [Candidatus Nitrosotalea sp.]|nr:Hsp20 family protein [Candidatus Nitrosotalea sp.]